MRIAIVGSGISGLVCARQLHRSHDVTVFEADERVGGHAHTVEVELDGRPVAVDTGFIVFNRPTYPAFSQLLDELGVATQPSVMNFSVRHQGTGFEYRSDGLGVLAQPANLASPTFGRMLIDLGRFNRRARRLVERHRSLVAAGQASAAAALEEQTVEDLATDLSDAFRHRVLVPLGSAIWSADPSRFLDFPALAYARFMDDHGLLRLRGRPPWRTVTGGSRRYVEALTAPFADRIRLGTPVHKVRRHLVEGRPEVEVLGPTSGPERFDHVILACHSPQALELLSDPTGPERDILGAVRYQPNQATLHTDARLLPSRRRAWASWNVQVGAGATTATGSPAVAVTYWMNQLQALEVRRPLLVTLNRHDGIDPAAVLGRFAYEHPVFDLEAQRAQRRRPEIQGRHGTWFAGAYWGSGFHEDGVQSALDVCQGLTAGSPEAVGRR
jgi:uncharacterized protein